MCRRRGWCGPWWEKRELRLSRGESGKKESGSNEKKMHGRDGEDVPRQFRSDLNKPRDGGSVAGSSQAVILSRDCGICYCTIKTNYDNRT